jgi:hypothetical protein
MTLGTGTAVPTGGITVGEDIYPEGGPRVFFQSYEDCPEANEPDSDGFYWGLSGTTACPVYEVTCYEAISLVDTVTRNPVTCDALGTVDEIQRRDSMELQFTIKSLFPFSQLVSMLRGSGYTLNATEEAEKFGVGEVPNELFHVFFSRIYDSEAGDYYSFTGHRARFVEASPLNMPYADVHNIAVVMKLFADRTKPPGQYFGTFVRYDPSVL